MSVLFISHSNVDQAFARRLIKWLTKRGWQEDQIFFSGEIPPTEEWRPKIDQALEECEVLLALLSDDYSSPQCVREFSVADAKGKRIITLLVRPLQKPLPDFLTDAQYIDLSRPGAEQDGFADLSDALFAAGVAPGSFPWPPKNDPKRAVFRGLQALDVQDAAIFFGRNTAISQGLEKLAQIRNGATHRILVILGASGAGKSSFLRAGLVARLENDRQNFLPLPVIRPERAAISSAYGLAASLKEALGRPLPRNFTADDVLAAFRALRARATEKLNHSGAVRGPAAKPPTIVIPIDQGEELFGAQNTEKEGFCTLLAEVLDRDSNAIALFTIRTPSYDKLQAEPAFERLPQDTYSLPATISFRDIIEGPAELAKPRLRIQPELRDQLIADLQGADALPLLGFTLERLLTHCGADGEITLAEYENELGGLSGAIQIAVESVLGKKPTDDELKIARSLFVPRLVKVDEEGVKRLTARKSVLPPKERELADRFINQRLLSSDLRSMKGRDEEIIEVAHEAILRQWQALRDWIEEDRDDLHDLERLRRAARDWRTKNCADTWLVHRGDLLTRAYTILDRPDYGNADDVDEVLDYLNACNRAEQQRQGEARAKDAEIVALRAENEAFREQVDKAARERQSALKELAEKNKQLAAEKKNSAGAETLRAEVAAAQDRVKRAEMAVVALKAEAKKRDAAAISAPPLSASAEEAVRRAFTRTPPPAPPPPPKPAATARDDYFDDEDYRHSRFDSVPWAEIRAGVAIGAIACVLVIGGLSFTQWGRDQFPILDRGHGWIIRKVDAVTAAVGGLVAPETAQSARPEAPVECSPQSLFAGADGANVRAAATRESAALGRLPAGASVTTSGCPTMQGQHSWYAITLSDGRSGFVRADVLGVAPPAPPARLEVAAFEPAQSLQAGQNGVYVREAPNRESEVLTELDPDTPLRVNGRVVVAGRTWYRVRLADGRSGFVRADVTEAARGTVIATSTAPSVANYTPPSPLYAGDDGANIRATPQRNGALLVRLDSGVRLNVTGRAELPGHDWFRVALPDGRVGFVREDVVAAAPPAPGPLNPRSVSWARRPTPVQIEAAYFRRPGPLTGRVNMQMRCIIQSDGGLDSCTIVRPQESSRALQMAAERVARLYRLRSLSHDGASLIGRPIIVSVTFDSEGGSTSD